MKPSDAQVALLAAVLDKTESYYVSSAGARSGQDPVLAKAEKFLSWLQQHA